MRAQSIPIHSPVETGGTWTTRTQPSHFQSDASILDLVAARANSAPGDIAIVTGQSVIRYGELESVSNRLARYLLALGAGPDALVAICLPRSAELITTALGIMKAGAAYIPFDPAHPVARISALLADAAPLVVITNESLAGPLIGPWKLLSLDRDTERIDEHSPEPLDITVQSEQVAYVIYTSGSTGQPKGVRVPQRALLNLVQWHQQAFSVTPSDRATLLASPAFDASVWEIWPYLAAGSRIHVVPDSTRSDPNGLRDWLVNERITISFVPTALAERLITLTWPSDTPLRYLLTGADSLHKFPPADLPFVFVNNYGPTECAVVSTSGMVPAAASAIELPTIGRPIANVQVYIVNELGKEVPTGEIGEICISGSNVALGYLNAPELTAAKFVPNPFDSEPDSRLYRTGDLGRYLPDGQIAFAGRLDEQIKVRGYRVEPNEVTAVLSRHPAIRECAVVACGDNAADKSLLAYVVFNSASEAKAEGLRQFLSTQLPEFMIPSRFVSMDELPLNAGGKVDRRCLPAPVSSNSATPETTDRTCTGFEERLSEILSEILGVQGINVEDNFFLLGGHSLLATQLIARIHQAFDVDLRLRAIFDTPTIAELAEEVQRLVCARLDLLSDTDAEQALERFADERSKYLPIA